MLGNNSRFSHNPAAADSGVRVFDTIAALRLNSESIKTAIVKTYSGTAGIGGGQYIYDSSDSTTADNGGTCIVDGAGRRFKLFYANDGEITDDQFGCVGDETTDDTTQMTKFYQSAMELPGVRHRIRPLRYKITSLPDITVSNVILVGTGGIGAKCTTGGTTLCWYGSAGATIHSITSVSGASNYQIKNITYKNIVYDCRSVAAKSVHIASVFQSEIHLGEIEATSKGFEVNVVASLIDVRDTQENDFLFYGYQMTNAAPVLWLDGDSGANTSLNKIRVIVVHKNASAVVCANSDNNSWPFVRTYCAAGGSASYSVELRGGSSSALSCRDEKFNSYVATNKPIHAFGTNEGYAVASVNHTISGRDLGNGTPTPTKGTGASISEATMTAL
jgi:hypothetical protein